MQNKNLLIGLAVLIVLGGVYWSVTQKGQKAMQDDAAVMEDKDARDGKVATVEVGGDVVVKDVVAMVMNNAASKTGALVDVTGGTSSGTAYVLRDGGKLYHYVEATLPDQHTGTFYEGWLVKKEPSLMFFSTGKMEKDEDGKYVLSYTSDNEYPDYDDVVITLETVADDTPETHIIEGKVK